jgi:fructose-bisphosphate aldolase/2-amino-3,7-dideoxy-D-threo-hept-6-ulosonate synthase
MIDALSLSKKFWPILALDHGLTVGNDAAVSMYALPGVLDGCRKDIGAAVMTYGLARFIRSQNSLPLIIQCFGAPLGHPKFKVCTLEQALKLDARGVAVQVDFSLSKEELRWQLQSVSILVGQAHGANLPVLFMIRSQEDTDLTELSKSIRFCIELGADLIKARCDVLDRNQKGYAEFRAFLGASPPVLLAGGAANNDILSEVSAAREVGFSGYCIGRNIFQASNPSAMSRMLREAWLKPVK